MNSYRVLNQAIKLICVTKHGVGFTRPSHSKCEAASVKAIEEFGHEWFELESE